MWCYRVTCIELDIYYIQYVVNNFERADFDPERRYDDLSFENPVFDDQGTAGGYDPSKLCEYQDETNLQYEAQSVKMAVDDFYKYFEEKGLKTGPTNYNDFELVNSKFRVKGS